MSNKVLIYSRFPKAMMVRIGERFELMDAAGKPPSEVFAAEQLSGITRDGHGGRHAARSGHDGSDAEARRDRLLWHRL